MTTRSESPATATASSTTPRASWVVGVDGSECASHAARWAVHHAPGRTGAVRLATAWSIPNAPALPPIGPMEKYWDIEAFEASARASVDALASSLRSDSTAGQDAPVIDIDTVVAEGQSSSVLLRLARDADLLVVGSRGRGGFARLVMGSTSTQCATHAPVPTVVVPANAAVDAVAHIVVAIDGSRNSLAALEWAIAFAAPGARIECISVWDVSPIAVGADQFFFPEAGDLARERFEHQVEAVVDASALESDSNISVTGRFIDGHPRADLSAAAESCDLFVMGARGHGAMGSVLLGSVSTWLLHHVSKPMVVVPCGESAVDTSTADRSVTSTNTDLDASSDQD